MNHPKYRPDIDGLRALAILSVVGFHAFPAALTGGYIGVDIFFVISGYLISTIMYSNLAKGKFSFTEFYVRRIKRIFPALLTVLLAFYVVGWHTMFSDEFTQYGKHLLAGALFVSNFALLQESGYFDVAANTKPLLHLWSLAIEEQFYILWPLMVYLLWRVPRTLPWVVIALLVGSFAVNIIIVDSDPSTAFYMPVSRFWELLSGSMLAYLAHSNTSGIFQRLQRGWVREIYALCGLILLIVPIFLLNSTMTFPGWLALLPVAGAWITIHAGADALANKWVLSNRLMIWVGLISYPLYLWHWPVLTFSLIHGINEGDTVFRAVLVLISILLAWMTYKWIEQPVRFAPSPRLGARALVILMAAIGITGFATFDQGGFRSRSFNSHNIQADYDWINWYRFNKCFIEAKEGPASFSDICDGPSTKSTGKPLVLLWGDSHAASLYPGLQQQSDLLGFDIAQYTTSGCPPIADFVAHVRQPLCPAINDHVLDRIKTLDPDLIVISAYWLNYNGKGDWNKLDLDLLKSTLSSLTSTHRVIVVGQLPVADVAQPHVAARIFKPHVTDHTSTHFLPEQFQIREPIESIASQSGAEFFAPTDILCNASGCLISTTAEALTPVAWDYGHLTMSGSQWLISNALAQRKLSLPASKSIAHMQHTSLER